MKTLLFPLVSWQNGTIMIGVFALVCVLLAAVVINMVMKDSNNKSD